MQVIAHFTGLKGEIRVLEETRTGARYYEEGGILQSYVLPQGRAGVAYVRAMAAALSISRRVLVVGCGGGALASELHGSTRELTVVDNNPLSFEIAREFFWMPHSIRCVSADMLQFLLCSPDRYDGIGVDVGGPCFDYDSALNLSVCAQLAEHLSGEGRVAINIANDFGADIDAIVARLSRAGLKVTVIDEGGAPDRNILLLCVHNIESEMLAAEPVCRSSWHAHLLQDVEQ